MLSFAGFVSSQPACHQMLIKVKLQKDETVLKAASVLAFSVVHYASVLEGKIVLSRMLGGTLGLLPKAISDLSYLRHLLFKECFSLRLVFAVMSHL